MNQVEEPAFGETEDRMPSPDESTGWRIFLYSGVLMLVGLVLLAWLGTPRHNDWQGQGLPTVDLQPLIGSEQSIGREDIVGKVAVLHFWGTWCPPCRLEFPEFVKVFSPLSERDDLMVLSVSCSPGPEYDLEELREKTAEFLAPYAVPFPTYCDPTAMTREQLALLAPGGSFAYPTTIVVDKQGKIVTAVVGYREGEMEEMGRVVRDLLGD